MRARRWPALFIALFTLTLTAGPAAAQPAPTADATGGTPQATHPVVRWATHSDTTPGPLRALPVLPPRIGELFQIGEEGDLPGRENGGASTPDTAVQTTAAATTASKGTGFEGIGNVDGVLPPDPNADISPTQIVETVNLSFAVYSRTGTKLYGPANINTLWQGFGGACETSNDGDPVVQYDQLADRWMISQFALPRFPRGPFYQCIAVSQTSSAIGAYNRYEFLISNNKLNDYPKFGVWPDAYYMSINQFSCRMISCSWAGAGAIAFDRVAMLNGQPAQMVYFDLYNTDPNLGGMLPSDLDGTTLPPNGAANQFAQMDDNAWGYSPDQLQLWGFHVDWSNPGASTFTRTTTMPVAPFDSDMCGYARNCIAQPGGTKLDALSDRLMYRLAYRNSSSGTQSLVVNHTVDANGNDRAGVRWYELQNTGSGWGVSQQGTYAPSTDNASRWVGSAAMNKAGDLAIGYSVSSTSISPSIRVAGRQSGDPAGSLGPELSLVTGSGYQTHSSGRWGDYTSLVVDPLDDCTFWYTGEYTAAASSASWHTYIGSFTISSCGTSTALSASFTADKTSGTAPLTVQFTDTSTGSPTGWQWDFGDGSPKAMTQDASHTYSNAGSYTVKLTVTNGVDPDSTATTTIHVTAPAAINLTVTGYKVKGLQKADLNWTGASGSVDIFRDGSLLTTVSGSPYTDNIDNRGSGSYTYKVCEAGSTTACSDPVTITF